MNWFRVYHGILRDTKIELLAQTAGVPRYLAAAAWVGVLQYASEKEDRGSVAGIKARWLAVEVGCAEDEALRLLRGMVTEGLLTRNPEGEGARIASWEKRQPADPTAAERMARMRRRRKALPDVMRNGDGGDGVTPVTRRNGLHQSRADKNREDSPPIRPPRGAESERKKRPAQPSEEPQGFAEFYAAYPKKVARAAAARAYAKARKSASADQIMSGLMDARAEWSRLGTERRFIPGPSPWLNDERWTDEHPAPAGASPGQTSVALRARELAAERARRVGNA